MSEVFYQAIRAIGLPALLVASRPLVLHAERARQAGGCLLAANHESAFDAPLLVGATPRMIYWLSIVELFQGRFANWFLRSFGAMPLDRSKPDALTVRKVVRHLRAGRMVGLFPEGQLRRGMDSVLQGGEMDEGVVRLAQLASVPILPCVVAGGANLLRWQGWLPLRRTRWAVAYGEPIPPAKSADAESVKGQMEALRTALQALDAEVRRHVDSPT